MSIKFTKIQKRPQDFSRGRRVVSYPKACIRLPSSDRFRDHRSVSAQRMPPGHCGAPIPLLPNSKIRPHSVLGWIFPNVFDVNLKKTNYCLILHLKSFYSVFSPHLLPVFLGRAQSKIYTTIHAVWRECRRRQSAAPWAVTI